MENKDIKEREVSLQELLWQIAFDWRRLLLCAVIIGILAGTVRFTGDFKTYKNAKASEQMTDKATEVPLTEEERILVQDAKILQNSLNESREYMQNSILMSIDPYQENVLVLQYYVDSDYTFNYTTENAINYTDAIVSAYTEHANGGAMAAKIVETLGLDCEARYMEELIGAAAVSTDQVFSVEVVYPDSELLEAMSGVLKAELAEQTTAINDNIGSHSLKLLSENIVVRADAQLAAQQKNIQDMLTTYRTQLTAITGTMTEDQLKELGREVSKDAELEEIPPVVVPKPEISVKYIVLGVMAGLFLSMIWTVCKVLFAGKLQQSDEIADIYGIRLFGILKEDKNWTGIDKLLMRLKNRRYISLSKEEYLDIVCSNMELACRDDNINSICLCGTELKSIPEALMKVIISRMDNVGIKVTPGGNIRYDMAALRQVKEIGTVVILEQTGVSGYQEIDKEIKTFAEQNVKVLGCVCVE